MNEKVKARRKQLDHERYMRNQKERQKKQREYYASHREMILHKKKKGLIR